MKVVLKCKYGSHEPLSIVEVETKVAETLIREGNAVAIPEEDTAPKKGVKNGKDS